MAAVAKLKKMFHAKPTKHRERREVNRMRMYLKSFYSSPFTTTDLHTFIENVLTPESSATFTKKFLVGMKKSADDGV